MAGRFQIETVFSAIDRLSAPVAKMSGNVDSFIKKTEGGLGKIDKFNSRVSSGLKTLGAVGTGLAVAGAAVVKDIVQTGSTFDKTLVGAAAKFDPTITRGTAGFKRLSEAAQRVGADTEFNAQQGAEALKSLASAGFDADQAISSLPGVVDLATASEVDLGTASEMATKSLGAFGLKTDNAVQLAKNLAHVNDVLAMAAGKTDASMEGLFESIKEGAPVAIGAGASMETFTAMAAAMAGAGIEGSTAGTTLKNVFTSLAAPTAKAAKQLKKLGIATKDSKGDLRDALAILGDLEEKTKGMGTADRTAVIERIFGKIPIAGVTAMLEKGTKSIGKLRGELEHSDNYVKNLANTMRDTVAGDIDGFTSAIDGVKTALFDTNTGPIRDVIQSMTAWVKANQGLIVQKVGDAVKWIGDNLPAIVKWAERIAYWVAAFYAWSAAIKTVQLAIETYEAGAAVAKGTTWLFVKSLKGARGAADLASGSLGAMRGSLNATGLAKSINGITGTLGKAGMLGAALAVGVAIGTWLNETFELDKKIAGWVADLTGLSNKLGDRSDKPPDFTTDDKVFQDGSVQAPDGTWKYRSPERIEKEARALEKLQRRTLDRANAPTSSPLYNAPEPQIMSPQVRAIRTESQHTDKQHTEIVIKDETGRAIVKNPPKAGSGTSLQLQQSGAF